MRPVQSDALTRLVKAGSSSTDGVVSEGLLRRPEGYEQPDATATVVTVDT